MLTRLTRGAIIITAMSAVVIFLTKDIGRMLTTQGDLLVWRVPFSQLFLRVPDGAAFLVLLPPLAFTAAIVVWGFITMTFVTARVAGWKVHRMAARANMNPSDTEHAYVQGFAVSFFPVWLAALILLVLGWAAWKVAPWAISLLP